MFRDFLITSILIYIFTEIFKLFFFMLNGVLESLQSLDDIKLNFSPESLLCLNITLALIMFGVALDIKIENFKKIIHNPKSVIIGVVSQFLLLPALTFLLAILFRNYITTSIALGMILVASCPGGNISNFMSSLSKANIALSVSLTAIATLAAIIMTPLNFTFWGGMYNISSPLLVPIKMPVLQIFQTVFVMLGIPLILGILFAKRFPIITSKIIKPVKFFSIIIFVGFIIFAFMNNYEYFKTHIKYVFIIVLVHNALALLMGYSFSSIFKTSFFDKKSITIETGIQNSALALVIIFNPKIFPPELSIGGMAFIAAWWGIWHIFAGLGIAIYWSRKKFAK